MKLFPNNQTLELNHNWRGNFGVAGWRQKSKNRSRHSLSVRHVLAFLLDQSAATQLS